MPCWLNGVELVLPAGQATVAQQAVPNEELFDITLMWLDREPREFGNDTRRTLTHMAAVGRFLGLMSGTSMDGIDAALVRIRDGRCELEATGTLAYPDATLDRVRAAARGDRDDLATVASLDRELGFLFAKAALELLHSAQLEPPSIDAIGSHGQTLRHDPHEDPERRFSLQIADPSTIAEVTGITTVADFRRRDIAAGGQGAPLVPLFHGAQFGAAGSIRAIVNIGGIANATILENDEVIGGFDCGPGNTLLDAWIREERGDPFDANGAWAAEHEFDAQLLESLLEDPFFAREGPRSTGPERFNLPWLARRLPRDIAAGSVQATLSELTAVGIFRSLGALPTRPDAVFVCGGGARNTDLMRRLHRYLDPLDVRLGTTDEIGLAAEWVEAAAFAWLAKRTLDRLPGNAPVVTGARGPRILGAIHPAA